MSTHAFALTDEDTRSVSRPAEIAPRRSNPPFTRLADMDLDPPAGPVPAGVIAYFEAALERERRRNMESLR